MKSLALYLLIVFALTCGMLAVVKAIDPPEPVLVFDAAAKKPEEPSIPSIVCIPALQVPLKGRISQT